MTIILSIKLFSFCILGSTFLMLLKSPVFESAKFALLDGIGYGGSLFGEVLYRIRYNIRVYVFL